MIVAAVLSLPFLFLIVRRPLQRRLALRNALRRPREAALVILGSMFGTAIIAGSLIVGDTMNTSIRGLAYTRLGPIDELIVSTDPAVADEAERLVTADLPERVDGVLSFARLEVAATAGEGDNVRAEPAAGILELDFERAAAFGDDPEITGVTVPTPPAGHAVITEPLATVLDAGPGDRISVFAYGTEQVLEVDAVIEATGVAGFRPGFFNEPSDNVLVGPGFLDAITTQVQPAIDAGEFVPPERALAISNEGGVETGDRFSDEVTAALEERLGDLDVGVFALKQQVLEEADEDSASFSELFTAMGTFGVLAGVLLLVNIFVMLAEERKSELGMLRAVGLRRSRLVALFSIEGWIYSIISAAIGTLVGLGLGAAIIGWIRRIFESGNEVVGLPLRFSATFDSLQTAFGAGFAISAITVVITSWRISRFNVISAIRDLPDDHVRAESVRWLVLGGIAAFAGAVLTAAGLAAQDPISTLLGPVLLLAGLIPLLWNRFDRRRVITVSMGLILAWAIVAFGLLRFFEDDAGIFVFVAQGIVTTAAAVVLVSQHQELFEKAARRLGVSQWAMAARLGLAYPTAKRMRTGLTLAMYSLVIFTLTFISVLAQVFSNQVGSLTEQLSGGYDIFMTSNPGNPVPVDKLREIEGVDAVAPMTRLETEFEVPGLADGSYDEFWTVSAFDESFIEGGIPEMDDNGDFATDEEAYRAVLADPSLIIVDQFFLQGDGGPSTTPVEIGDTLIMKDPLSGRSREVTVVAEGPPDFLINGALYGAAGAREIYGARVVPNRAYVGVEGRPPADVAAEISGAFIVNGADAESIQEIIESFVALQNQFFQLFRGYLGFGLLVGIAGLGVIMVRAVRERRREIGVLRSLGFEAATVRRSFVFESTFVALEGTLIGVGLALVTAYNVFANTEAFGDGAAFAVPVIGLSVVVLGTLVASLLATAAPTRAASRIRPAVALRIAD